MTKRVELKREPVVLTLAGLLEAGGSRREEQRRAYAAMQAARRVALKQAREECLTVIQAALDSYAAAKAKGRLLYDGLALAETFGISLSDYLPDHDEQKHLEEASTLIGFRKMGLQAIRAPQADDKYRRDVDQMIADAQLPRATKELLEKIDAYAESARLERRHLRRALRLPQLPEDSKSMGAARQRRYRENHPDRVEQQSKQQQLRKKAHRAWQGSRESAQRFLSAPDLKLSRADRVRYQRRLEQPFQNFLPEWVREREEMEQRWREQEEREHYAEALGSSLITSSTRHTPPRPPEG